ncbi:hypothetical protein [Bacteroides salyersiae]|uniref:hypothetical protein n=1 Tax=Bacteroides salyersiae TaxID=291644 RepID=UPI002166A67B|nr:hypothetical protein [Bacteroides salyersiae]MCS3057447.1 hypothetical protein [Bacteroides salyersiae]
MKFIFIVPLVSLTENGFLDEAAYRTASGAVMTDKTFPKPFLSDNSDGGLRIRNVIMEDDKLTFRNRRYSYWL